MVQRATLLPEVKKHYGDLKNLVGGQWVDASATEWLDDTNPATDEVIARVPLSPKGDVDAAVQAALGAWEEWRETPPISRARYFFNLKNLMEAYFEELARIVSQDHGKIIDEARGEVRRAIENVEVAAGIPSLMMGYNLEDGAAAGIDEEVLYQPLGVFAGISPFNFPAMVQSWFWPYAVATGNCWIAKPSEQDPIVPNMISSVYGTAGERCLAGSVIVGIDEAREPVSRKFTEHASKLKIGYGLDETTQMGPGISRKHQERVLGHIDKGEDEGATVSLDGRGCKVAGYPGYFVGPTVLDDVTPEMAVANEEIFGPVASVLEMDGLDDAIEWINRSPYGNAASIYTSSGKAARDFRYRAKAGSIGINIGVAAAMAYFPFGGMKNSFFGDLHPQGRDAIRFFTESKVVITRWV